ncbi:MAG TPA: hypothetical protein VHW70_15505 [Edaphobacter sp.]|jgi:hypothetical protein|nr:hypothetical protein [Edaphobacter sp.]
MSPIVPRAVLSALLLVALPASAQTQSSPLFASPVGHWVAEHPSHGGIGSWWDFRPDGTLTMHIGAIITSTITRSGDTFTSPPATATGAAITVTFHMEGTTLHIKSADGQEQTFARIGTAPSASDPLLGKWQPLPSAIPSTDPNVAAQQKLMTTAILAFFPDNIESVRIPFSTSEGTWDRAAHTFHINNQKETYTFQMTGPKLSLGQPPDGRKTDTYIPDPIV